MAAIGLLGSGHCVGMCGGIATGLGFAARGRSGLPLVLGYNLGRILSYTVAGALVASLGYWGSRYLALGPLLRMLAGVILILMGLYLVGWWRALAYLERAGARLWRHIQPLGKGLLPVTSFPHALGLGVVWGWLPCGLVYTALAYAATAGSAGEGALLMAAFGLGTAPAMVAGGVFSGTLKRVLQARPLRMAMAAMMIGFGVWTLVGGISHRHADPAAGAAMESHHHGH